jgi:hypothetical protein
MRRGQTYSFTDSALDEGVVKATLQSVYPEETNPVTIVQEADWASRSVRMGAETLPCHRGSTPKPRVVVL